MPTIECSNPSTEPIESTTTANDCCFQWNYLTRHFNRRHKPTCNICSCGFWCCCHRYPRQRIPNENLLILSIIQILCGTASVILASVAVSRELFLYQLGTGLWAGIVMLATGVLGVITARQKRLCTIISLLVMCVLSSISAILLTVHSVVGLIQDGLRFEEAKHFSQLLGLTPRLSSHQRQTILDTNGYSMESFAVRSAFVKNGPVAHMIIMHSLLLIVSLLELSVALTTAVIVCRQICCGQVHYVSGRTVLVTGQSDLIHSSRSRHSADERRSNYLSNRNPYFIPLHTSPNSLWFNNNNNNNNTNNNSGQNFTISGAIPGSYTFLENPSLSCNSATGGGASGGCGSNNNNNGVDSRGTCASMLYILPSPTREDTALVFPAFPPAYSSSTTISSSSHHHSTINNNNNPTITETTPLQSTTISSCIDRSNSVALNTNNTSSIISSTLIVRDSGGGSGNGGEQQCIDSAFITSNNMGFRPVVLIHSLNNNNNTSNNLNESPPPEYSTLDRRTTAAAHHHHHAASSAASSSTATQ